MPKLQFLMCGSPNDAFWSQAAIYRRSLDELGGIYRSAQLVLALGAPSYVPLPERWHRHFERIVVAWVSPTAYEAEDDSAQNTLLFKLLDHSASLCIICDADTMLMRPLPSSLLEELQRSPAIGGAIAHVTPPRGVPPGKPTVLTEEGQEEPVAFWREISRAVLGREVELAETHTFRPGPCPRFYINYGFMIATPELFRRLHHQLETVEPKVREVFDNDFEAQIALALAVERGALPTRVLTPAYNLPNDPRFEKLHPDSAREPFVIHYLRKTEFDRHRIFASRDGFEEFLALRLEGSNLLFQERVRRITGSVYPFS